MNSKLETMALHCRLSNVVAQLQLQLAWQLQSKLRVHMPSCMVIPFGAPFSGHGTVSSDCDLCVISEPEALEVAVFSGPAYLPPHLHTQWQRLQPLPSAPSPQPQPGGREKVFDVVMEMVKTDHNCSKVLPIRRGRCPIIRFLYKPHQLHCDISFDNRYNSERCVTTKFTVCWSMQVFHCVLALCAPLYCMLSTVYRLGPANTRLLAAYMNFDPRMAVLVPCVRLWARGQGLKRTQLNSYALSLMLIHSLQHSSPPVLPCLQVSTAAVEVM